MQHIETFLGMKKLPILL